MTQARSKPRIHRRRSIRLKGYDYSQAGAYFVTVVTFQRKCLFGNIADREMQLNKYGKIARECWVMIPDHFLYVELGEYVVMPNHVHGIVVIHDAGEIKTKESPSVGARHASPLPPRGVPSRSLGAIVGSFKSAVTKRIGHESNVTGIWQRNYYEHIIRSEKEMENIWKYIEANPSMWADDHENPLKAQ